MPTPGGNTTAIPARRVSILKSSSHRGMDVSSAQGEVHIRHPVRSALVAAVRVNRLIMAVCPLSMVISRTVILILNIGSPAIRMF